MSVMTPDMQVKLRALLIDHEGKSNFPYVDTVGKITVGIGYNLSDRGLSDDWVDNQFESDVNYFYSQLFQFEWFKNLNEARQIALIDMCFMGVKKFLSFKKMIAALEKNDYQSAALEMLNSKWAGQVGRRATDLARIMREGNL